MAAVVLPLQQVGSPSVFPYSGNSEEYIEDTYGVETDESVTSCDETDSVATPSLQSLVTPEQVVCGVCPDTSDGVVTRSASADTLVRSVSVTPFSYGGLNNLGNTCYMNSALQVLASLDHFVDQIKLGENTEGDDMEAKQFRKLFVEVMDALSRGETVRPDNFKQAMDELRPLFVGFRQQDSHEFLTTLLDLLDGVFRRRIRQESGCDELYTTSADTIVDVPEVESSCGHDENSSETFVVRSLIEFNLDDIRQLLHGSGDIEDEKSLCSEAESEIVASKPHCKLFGGRMPTLDNDRIEPEAVNVHIGENSSQSHSCSPSEKTPVEAYLKTEVRVRLTCDSCKFTRTHLETYFHLSLEIVEDTASVEDGLRNFFSPEKREIKCEKCFCETAVQTMEITRLPRALLLHLKRFIVDVSPDFSSITYCKNQSPVCFESAIEVKEGSDGVLSEFLAPDVSFPRGLTQDKSRSRGSSYEIRSIVNHIGSSASCGHYTADANRISDDYQRSWFRFNDSTVTAMSSEEAMLGSSRTAYMIMYELS